MPCLIFFEVMRPGDSHGDANVWWLNAEGLRPRNKKKSVCPVVGDLPPIYGKFSGENDDKHGFV